MILSSIAPHDQRRHADPMQPLVRDADCRAAAARRAWRWRAGSSSSLNCCCLARPAAPAWRRRTPDRGTDCARTARGDHMKRSPLRSALHVDAGRRDQRQRSAADGNRAPRSRPRSSRRARCRRDGRRSSRAPASSRDRNTQGRRRCRASPACRSRPKPGMLRHDHVEVLRQLLHERQPGAGAARAMQEQAAARPARRAARGCCSR